MTTKLEAGTQEQFTLTTSVTLDASPLFFLKDPAGTLVYSGTGVSSGTGQYSKFAPIPDTPGMYTFHWRYSIGANTFTDGARFEVVRTLAVETSGLYCNANQVLNLYDKFRESKMRNEEIDEFIRDVMNEINAKVGHKYGVPFPTAVSSFPPLIGTITKNLTLVNILKRKGAEMPEWLKDDREKYEGMLDAIAAGSMFLVLSGGTLIGPSENATLAQVDHNMENYEPTFNMLDIEYQRIDTDRQDDEEEALS